MPLLKLDNLTVKFGGLTAVGGVDCAVESGQIYSVIGPNGAGKTTVFNTISGIYEPTSGQIEFEGRRLERPVTWRIMTAMALVGVATGLAAALFALNIDNLWRATIKRNYAGPQASFSYAAVWRDGIGYVRGDLAEVEQQNGRWAIVSPDGRRTLGFAENQADADKLRANLEQMMDGAGRAAVAERDGKWVVESPDKSVLGEYESKDMARANLDRMAEIGRDVAARRTRTNWALLVGMVIGASGTWAVWSRSRRTPEVVAKAGVARTFQNIRLFENMTVLENVLTGMDRSFHCGVLAMALRTPRLMREEAKCCAEARELLAFVGLADQACALARNLPYGDQRRLEIARALATNPRLVLLDEPAAGMNPAESGELADLVDRIRDRGITVLLIEHHMKVVMGISDRVAVLDYGIKIAEGSPEEVRVNPEVIKAYLGSEEVT